MITSSLICIVKSVKQCYVIPLQIMRDVVQFLVSHCDNAQSFSLSYEHFVGSVLEQNSLHVSTNVLKQWPCNNVSKEFRNSLIYKPLVESA